MFISTAAQDVTAAWLTQASRSSPSHLLSPLKKPRDHFFSSAQVLGSIGVAELQMRQLFPNILSGKSFHNNGNHMKAGREAPPTIEEPFQLSGLHIGLHK